MARDAVIAARLDIIAGKASLLAAKYKQGDGLWDGELSRGLSEIIRDIESINNNGSNTWVESRSGNWYPDDK